MFLVVSRDLSTNRHQKGKKPLSQSMLSDKSPKKDKFGENWNGPARKFWNGPALGMVLRENF